MHITVFGTYDTAMHPRIATIAEGLAARGFDVSECNVPLGLDTAARVDMLARPWRAAALPLRLASRWAALARMARRMPRPDAVVVLSLIHISEPTRLGMISYAVFCLKKNKKSLK